VTLRRVSTCSTLTRIDAARLHNHHVAALTTASTSTLCGTAARFSRNESIVYGTKSFHPHYDYRLLDEGETYGFYLPEVWRPLEIVYWRAREARP